MKKTRGKVWRTVISSVLAFSLVASMTVPAFAAPSSTNEIGEGGASNAIVDVNGNGKIDYVSFGDSMTNGYCLPGYYVGNDDGDADNALGYRQIVPNTYTDLFAKHLQQTYGVAVEHDQLAISGMRIEELHFLLDEDYPGDIFTWLWFDATNNGISDTANPYYYVDPYDAAARGGLLNSAIDKFGDLYQDVDGTCRFARILLADNGDWVNGLQDVWEEGNTGKWTSVFPSAFENFAEKAGYTDYDKTDMQEFFSSTSYDHIKAVTEGADVPLYAQNANEWVRWDYQNSVKNADVITMSFGSNNFGHFVKQNINVLLNIGGDAYDVKTSGYDLEGILLKSGMTELYNEFIGDIEMILRAAIGAEELTANSEKMLDDVMDIMSYAFITYIYSFSESVDCIREMNPEAQLVICGMINDMAGVELSLPGFEDANGNSIVLPGGDVYALLVDGINSYMAAYDAGYVRVDKDGNISTVKPDYNEAIIAAMPDTVEMVIDQYAQLNPHGLIYQDGYGVAMDHEQYGENTRHYECSEHMADWLLSWYLVHKLEDGVDHGIYSYSDGVRYNTTATADTKVEVVTDNLLSVLLNCDRTRTEEAKGAALAALRAMWQNQDLHHKCEHMDGTDYYSWVSGAESCLKMNIDGETFCFTGLFVEMFRGIRNAVIEGAQHSNHDFDSINSSVDVVVGKVLVEDLEDVVQAYFDGELVGDFAFADAVCDLLVNDSEASSYLYWYARMLAGNGSGVHPTLGGHADMFACLKTAWDEGYTSSGYVEDESTEKLEDLYWLLKNDTTLNNAAKMDLIEKAYKVIQGQGILGDYPELAMIEDLYSFLTDNEYINDDQTLAIIVEAYGALLYNEAGDVDKNLTDDEIIEIAKFIYETLLGNDGLTDTDRIAIIGGVYSILKAHGYLPVDGETGKMLAAAEDIYAALVAEGFLSDEQSFDIVCALYAFLILNDDRSDEAVAALIDEVYRIVMLQDDLDAEKRARIAAIVYGVLESHGLVSEEIILEGLNPHYQKAVADVLTAEALEIAAKVVDAAAAAVKAAQVALEGFEVDADLAAVKDALLVELAATLETLEIAGGIIADGDLENLDTALAAMLELKGELDKHIETITVLAEEIGVASEPFIAEVVEAANAYIALAEQTVADIYAAAVEACEDFAAAYAAWVEEMGALADKVDPALGAAVRAFLTDAPADSLAIMYAYGDEALAKLIADTAVASGEVYQIVAALVGVLAEHGAGIYAELVASDDYNTVLAQIEALKAEIEEQKALLNYAPATSLLHYEQSIAKLEAELERAGEELYGIVLRAVEAYDEDVYCMVADLMDALLEALGVTDAALAEYGEWLLGRTCAMKGELLASLLENLGELADGSMPVVEEILCDLVECVKGHVADQLALLKAQLEAAAPELRAQIEAQIEALEAWLEQMGGIEAVYGLLLDVLEDAIAAAKTYGELADEEIQAKIVDATHGAVVATDGVDVLSLGDSNATGVGLNWRQGEQTYAEIVYDVLNQGVGADSADEASYEDLAIDNLRAEDLRYILDASYEIDAYGESVVFDGVDVEALRAEMKAAIEAADLIALSIGADNLSAFAVNQLWAVVEGGEPFEMDWTVYVGEEGVPYVERALAEIEAYFVEEGVPAEYTGLLTMLVESYAYSYVGFSVNYYEALELVKGINPDAHLVVVGLYNGLDSLIVEGTAIGEYIEYFVDLVDAQLTLYAALDADDVTFVAARDAETPFDDVESIADAQFLINLLLSENVDGLRATAAGHEYIAGQILDAVAAITVVDATAVYTADATALPEVFATANGEWSDFELTTECVEVGEATALVSGKGYAVEVPYEIVHRATVDSFVDFEAGSWYLEEGQGSFANLRTLFMDYALATEIMSGYKNADGTITEFGPWDSLDRAQAATVIYRMAVEDASATTDPAKYADNATVMADVEDGLYYTAAVNWCVENGIITGYQAGPNAGKFKPYNKVTRSELAAMIQRYCVNVCGVEMRSADVMGYDDSHLIDTAWALPGLEFCKAYGIMTGIHGKNELNPVGKANRAEASKMFSVVGHDLL